MQPLRLTLAAAAALASPSLFAADVTLYGSIDTGLRLADYSSIDGRDPGTTLAMVGGQYYSNLIGLKGEEKLSDGVSLGFVLEGLFNSDTGSLYEEERLFGNQAMLTLSGDKWTAAFGRLQALASTLGQFDMAAGMDPFEGGWAEAGGSDLFANPGLSLNNAVVGRFTPVTGLTLSAMYSLDVKEANEPVYGDNRHYTGLGANYAVGDLTAGVIFESVSKGRTGQATDNMVKAGITYDFGPVKAYATYAYSEGHDWYGQTLDAQSYLVGLTAPAAGGLVRASLQWLVGKAVQVENKTFEPSRFVASVGYTYPVSQRTLLWAVFSCSTGSGSLDKDTDASKAMASDESREQANRRMINIGVSHSF